MGVGGGGWWALGRQEAGRPPQEGRGGRTEAAVVASLLFQPDIPGMTSACKQASCRQRTSERGSEHERASFSPLALSVSLSLFGLNSDSGMIDAFDVFQVEWSSGCEVHTAPE